MRLASVQKRRSVWLPDRKNGLSEFIIFLPFMNLERMGEPYQKNCNSKIGLLKDLRKGVMPKTWAHQVIIITGASSGIGKALAYLLAPQTPQLVLVARDGNRLGEEAKHCETLGTSTLVVPTDVFQSSCLYGDDSVHHLKVF